MATLYVVHAESDSPFVRDRLLPLLPTLEFDRWVSAAHLGTPAVADQAAAQKAAMEASAGILVLVSASAASDPRVRTEATLAVHSGRPLVTFRRDATPSSSVAPELDRFTTIDGTEDKVDELWTALDTIPLDEAPSAPSQAEPIAWSATAFTRVLTEVVKRHNFPVARALLTLFPKRVRELKEAYPAESAKADLKALRQKRQFELMREYAEAIFASGSTDPTVRRQYGQALIELGKYDQAIEVLEALRQDPLTPPEEIKEAFGLIGRAWKQLYVNAPDSPEAPDCLRKAIGAYRTVCDKEPDAFWHAVNAASCLRRAAADGLPGGDVEVARRIAADVVARIDAIERKDKVKVWDHASRIEALLILGDYARADRALDSYLAHPEAEAFELSSTYRQFDQVLRLHADPQGAPLLERLWHAVHRKRAGGTAPDGPAPSTRTTDAGPVHMLIRVVKPDWKPSGDIPGLTLHARMGAILSAEGTAETVKALMVEPGVISIDQSRPSDIVECAVSVPFIKGRGPYPLIAPTYDEHGDAALVAIIDNGIDVLHRAFLDAAGASRIVAIWDQNDPTGPPPPGFAMGTLHTQADIAAYVGSGALGKKLGRNVYDATVSGSGHGTHVASIAAGRAIPPQFGGGLASEAKILAVISAAEGPIGYSRTHVEALAFIDGMADQLKLPVVVNVSQGMNAGAHDGNSLLEAAFDAFSGGGRQPGRIIVKSAGNEYGNGGHARVTLGARSVESLQWVRASTSTKSSDRIELWWSSGAPLSFRLQRPNGKKTAILIEDQGAPLDEGDVRMEFTKRHIDNGDSLLLVTVPPPVATGKYVLELEATSDEPADVHAWIERGATPPTSFTGPKVDSGMTLSVPGTARQVISVAAVGPAPPIKLGEFSSHGPTRDGRSKPDISAPGVGILAARGGTTDEAVKMSGTSMAAPHVAGAIALLLSRQVKRGRPVPAHSQITSALHQQTLFRGRTWDAGQGFGVINVEDLLQAF